MTELRECPFCGGEVKRVNMEFVCLGCSAVTQFLICSVTTHATRLWNTRSYDGLVRELVEALENAERHRGRPTNECVCFRFDGEGHCRSCKALTKARASGYTEEGE